MFGGVEPAKLRQLRILRLDVKEADLSRVEFDDCEIISLMVDETTRFGPSRPSVHQLLIATDAGGVSELLEPAKIADWLSRHSRDETPQAANAEATRLLDKVCRVMLRQHMIKERQEDRNSRLLESRYWSDIEEILMRAKWLERITSKASKGAHGTFLRMRDPYKLLVDQTSAAKAIWSQVAALPPTG